MRKVASARIDEDEASDAHWIAAELAVLQAKDIDLDTAAEVSIKRAMKRLRTKLDARGGVTERRVRWTRHLLLWAKSNVDIYWNMLGAARHRDGLSLPIGVLPHLPVRSSWLNAFEADLETRGWMPFEIAPVPRQRRTVVRFARRIHSPSDDWAVAVELNGLPLPEAAFEVVDETEGVLVLDGTSSAECVIETQAEGTSRVLHVRVQDDQWQCYEAVTDTRSR